MKTRKLWLFLFVVFATALSAQTITVSSRTEMQLATKAYYPVLSQKGDKMLFTSDGYNGLSLFTIADKKVTEISKDAGAGYEPLFDAQDAKIFYRKTSFENKLRMDAMESFEIAKNIKTLVLKPQRDLKQARNFQNGFVVTANRKLLKLTFGKNSQSVPVYVTTQDLKIYLYKNGKFTILNPLNQSENRYLWVSMSPGGNKILFTAAGKGTYVCDLSGKIISSLGYLNAPVWYDDNYVVGMQDKDDGQMITSSKIIMLSVDGKVKSEISSSNEIAMYPTAAAKASKIAYNTLDGKIMLVDIQIK